MKQEVLQPLLRKKSNSKQNYMSNRNTVFLQNRNNNSNVPKEKSKAKETENDFATTENKNKIQVKKKMKKFKSNIKDYMKTRPNYIWIVFVFAKLFLIQSQLAVLIVVWFQSENLEYFFQKIPNYGIRQIGIFNSLFITSISTNLFVLAIAYYSQNITTWLKKSVIVYSGIFLSLVQIVFIGMAFIISSICYINLGNIFLPSNFSVVITNFHNDTMITSYMNHYQREHKCCGVAGPLDWAGKNINYPIKLPATCCADKISCFEVYKELPDSAYKKGCYKNFMEDIIGIFYMRIFAYGVDVIIELLLFLLFLLAMPDFKIMRVLDKLIEEENLNKTNNNLNVKIPQIGDSIQIKNISQNNKGYFIDIKNLNNESIDIDQNLTVYNWLNHFS